jgi:hypothetical protein
MITSAIAFIAFAGKPGIQWYTDMAQGFEVAKETGRPIFLLSAAPQCSEVPGDW